MEISFKHRPFNLDTDIEIYESWLRARGNNQKIAWAFIPPIGYVILHNDHPVCIGFMIRCDNRTVINDGILSNPNTQKEVRQASVEYLRKLLLEEAEKFGAKLIIAQTDEPKLVARLEAQGYKKFLTNVTHLGRPLWQ